MCQGTEFQNVWQGRLATVRRAMAGVTTGGRGVVGEVRGLVDPPGALPPGEGGRICMERYRFSKVPHSALTQQMVPGADL